MKIPELSRGASKISLEGRGGDPGIHPLVAEVETPAAGRGVELQVQAQECARACTR